MINFILNHREKFEDIFSLKSHAIMFHSEDEILLNNLGLIFAMHENCKSEHKPCLMCSSCLKILNGNSIDTLIYPKGEVLLQNDVDEIIENLNLTPAENENKIYILKNFDATSPLLQNKLLKSIEEPPKFVKFVLLVRNTENVLPTIVSRCETINLKKFTKSEIEDYLKDFPSEKKQIISENSHGSLMLADSISKENNFFDNYNYAINLLLNLKNSKNLLKFSSFLTKNKQNFIEILNLVQYFLSDIIRINENKEELIENKFCYRELKMMSKEFSTLACLKIQNNIIKVKDMIKFNVSLNNAVDNFLLNILEEKWQNKK